MADTPSPEENARGKAGAAAPPKSGDETRRTIGEAERSFEAGRREAADRAREAQNVADKTAEAGADAMRANGEMLRQNIESAEQVVQAAVEVGMAGVEGFTRTVSRTFAGSREDGELSDQFSRNMRAISQASPSLTRVTQEASRAWLGLIKQSFRSNLEAMGELIRCRSVPDMMALQARVMRDNLRYAVDAGQTVVDASIGAMDEAKRAISAAGPPTQPPRGG